jgi:hypothetical protein
LHILVVCLAGWRACLIDHGIGSCLHRLASMLPEERGEVSCQSFRG